MLFDRMHLPTQAESEYQTALHLAPNDADVSNNYAVYLCQIGKVDQGVKRFELGAPGHEGRVQVFAGLCGVSSGTMRSLVTTICMSAVSTQMRPSR